MRTNRQLQPFPVPTREASNIVRFGSANRLTVEDSGRDLIISFSLPKSLIEDFEGFIAAQNRNWISATVSVSIGTALPGTAKWDYPFNRRCLYRMKSRKKRLEMIRELETSEFSRMISFRCSPDLWAKAKAYADHQGIAPAEHLQLCLAYHAELHRRNLDEKANKSLRDLKAKGKEIQP